MHFEDLWTDAEESFKEDLSDSLNDIIQRILIKFNTLNSLMNSSSKNHEELQKIKIHLMGEILLDFSHISSKENINVYQAMQTALYYKKIGMEILNHQDS